MITAPGKNNQQVIRFGAVGVVNTLIDVGLLFVLSNLGVFVVLANIISTTMAFVFSFFANRHYTFRRSGGDMLREMLLFTVVTLFGLWVLQSIVIAAFYPLIATLVDNESVALLASKAFATIVSLTWNYLLYARVVFVKR
jgi:putative flippase GtrA